MPEREVDRAFILNLPMHPPTKGQRSRPAARRQCPSSGPQERQAIVVQPAMIVSFYDIIQCLDLHLQWHQETIEPAIIAHLLLEPWVAEARQEAKVELSPPWSGLRDDQGNWHIPRPHPCNWYRDHSDGNVAPTPCAEDHLWRRSRIQTGKHGPGPRRRDDQRRARPSPAETTRSQGVAESIRWPLTFPH